MKKIFFLSVLAVGMTVTSFAQGHHYDDHYNQAYAQNQYYYYPEANVYYNPAGNNYSYYDQGNWHTDQNLPRTIILGANPHRVPVTYQGNAVWNDNHLHRQQYGNYNNGYGSYNQYGNAAPDGHQERVIYKRNKTIIKH